MTGARRRARVGPVHQDQVVAQLTGDTHPRLAEVADRWSELNARDTHRRGLTAIVNGLMPDRPVD